MAVKILLQADGGGGGSTPQDNTFTRFNFSDDVISGVPSRVTYAMWSNNVSILQTFFTGSQGPPTSTNDARYYYNIYGVGGADSASAQVELSVAYGHISGSGSITSDKDNPTKAVYGQFRNFLLDNPRSRFILNSGSVILNDFFAITIKRANLKQKLDAGNWELHLTDDNADKKMVHLIDDSGDSQDAVTDRVGRVLNVVSGTIAGGVYSGTTKHFGLCYPDYGIIILSPHILSKSIGWAYNTGSTAYMDQAGKFFSMMSASSYFAARSEELISSTHYFVRVKNRNYNYSTNPTFYSASDGTLIKSSFANDPRTYITSVGLYNNSNELVAVAKLSQPVAKSFEKEALIKVRLDF